VWRAPLSTCLHQALSTILAICLSGSLWAQKDNRITGWVVESRTNKPLVAVNVYLKDTYLGSTTNHDGYYTIANIPAGDYEIIVDMIGYQMVTQGPIHVSPGAQIEINFAIEEKEIVFERPVTVTATRGKALAIEIPASVDVVTAEDLELRNPDNIAQALETVQGVLVRDYGGPGDLKTISLRGCTAAQVLILLDGQRINNAQNGQVDLSAVSVEGIERIEVVRGGNSAIYGADAVGGVINIITRKPAKSQTIRGSFTGMAGSSKARSLAPSLAFHKGGYSASVAYKWMASDGNFTYTDLYGNEAERQNSDFTSHDLFAKYRLEFGDPHYQRATELSYKYFTSERGSPGGIDVPYYEARSEETNQQVNYLLTGKVFNLVNDFRLQGYYHSSISTYDNEEGIVDVHSYFDNRAGGTEIQMHSVLSERQVLTYGVGGRYDWLNARDFPEIKTRNAYHLFLLSESNLEFKDGSFLKSIYIVPSLRYDGTSDFGDRLSPKTGAVLNFGELWQTTLKFNVGTNYRAPTFNDLYWPEDARTKGNPDLKPESGIDGDIGLRLQYPILNGFYLESTYFANSMEDLIIWQETAGLWKPENIQKSKTQGVETNISFSPFRKLITLIGNYTFLHAINQSDRRTLKGKFLIYRPRHTVNISLQINLGIATARYQFHYTSYRYVNPANTVWLDPCTKSDLVLAVKPQPGEIGMNVSFQIRNVFNEEYQVIKHHPTPGREYRLNLGVRFSKGL